MKRLKVQLAESQTALESEKRSHEACNLRVATLESDCKELSEQLRSVRERSTNKSQELARLEGSVADMQLKAQLQEHENLRLCNVIASLEQQSEVMQRDALTLSQLESSRREEQWSSKEKRLIDECGELSHELSRVRSELQVIGSDKTALQAIVARVDDLIAKQEKERKERLLASDNLEKQSGVSSDW